MRKLKYTENVFARHATMIAISVLLIAIVLACFGNVIVGQINRSMEDTQQKRMPAIMAAVDTRFQEISIAASQLLNDANLQIVVKSDEPLTSFERYRLYLFNQDLRLFVASHSLWDNVFIYLRKTDYCQEGIYSRSIKDVYDSWDYGIDEQTWEQMVLSLKAPSYLSFPSRQQDEKRYVEVWFPIAQNRDDALGMLVIRLDTSALITMLNGMCSSNWEHLALMDQEGTVICSTMQQIDEGSLSEYSTAVIVSPLSGWTYVSMTRNEFLRQTAVACERIFVYGVIVACLIAILSGIVSLARNIRPLEQVYSVVAERNEQHELPRSANEAGSYLAQSFREMAGNLDMAQMRLLKQREYVRDHLLIRLLMPSWNSSYGYSPDIYAANGVVFTSDTFFTLMITYHDNHQHGEMHCSDRDEYLIQQKINTLAESLFQERYNAMFVTYDFNSIGIMNVPDGISFDVVAEDIERTCLSMENNIKEGFGLISGFILSRAVKSVNNLHDAAQECFDVDDYYQDEGKVLTGFIRYTENLAKMMESAIPEKSKQNSWSEFEQALQSSDFSTALTIAEDSFAQVQKGSRTEKFACSYGIAGSLLTALESMEGITSSSIQEELNATARLMACGSLEQLQEETKKLIFEAQLAITNGVMVQRDDKLDQIKDYVDAHYADCNLGVSELADQAQMSLSGLSRAFKRKMGYNLLDYINQVRIKAVMRELSETDHTLAEIAERTGFTNTNTLSRNFKHFIGITPGKYKKYLGENCDLNKSDTDNGQEREEHE